METSTAAFHKDKLISPKSVAYFIGKQKWRINYYFGIKNSLVRVATRPGGALETSHVAMATSDRQVVFSRPPALTSHPVLPVLLPGAENKVCKLLESCRDAAKRSRWRPWLRSAATAGHPALPGCSHGPLLGD